MQVYLDESGDLGWKLSAPFRYGGSSRYLCLAFLILPKIHHKLTRGVITAMYQKYGWKDEKKSSTADPSMKLEFARAVVSLLASHPEIKIDCIIANKEKVATHIRNDPNKLYNYMCRLVVPGYVKGLPQFEFIPDKRSVKVESGNSLSDYLQTHLWFDCSCSCRLINRPAESARNYNLQFVDWIANSVWANFESGKSEAYKILSASPSVRIRKLYF